MARVKTELYACPFPKGKKAEINCGTVRRIELKQIGVKSRVVYVCDKSDCVYFDDV